MKNKKKTRLLTVTEVPGELYDEVKRLADREQRSVSAQARVLLELALREIEKRIQPV